MSFLGVPGDVVSKVCLGSAILGGAIMCFFGFRLFKVVLCLAGLLVGAAAAAYFALWHQLPDGSALPPLTYLGLIEVAKKAQGQTVIIVCTTVGGIGGALLAGLVHQAGVFLLGAWLGQLVAQLTMAGSSNRATLMVTAILVLIGGVLAIIMRKTITIVSTGVIGSSGLMFGMYTLLKGMPVERAARTLQKGGNDLYVLLGCASVLAVIGIYVQFAMAPEGRPPEPVYKKVKKKGQKKEE